MPSNNASNNKRVKLPGIGELQRSMERFESYNDGFILPDCRIVIRLDAHRFGDWSDLADEYPTGPEITKVFHETAIHLMTSSFRVKLSYVQGDEISLFLDPVENANPLRRSSIISAFSSAAAIHFLKGSGLAATFDARLSELPSTDRLIEYFLWQRRYCYRNAILVALRRALIATGQSAVDAERALHGVPERERIAHLERLGIPLSSLSSTTLKGALFAWKPAKSDKDLLTIASFTSLPDDDQEFIKLIGYHSGLSVPQHLTFDTSPKPDREMQISDSPQLIKSEIKGNRKTNISVFKVPSTSKR